MSLQLFDRQCYTGDNYRRFRCYRRLIISGVDDTSNQLIAGAMESMNIRDAGLFTGIKDHRQYPDTGEQLIAGVVEVYQNLLTMMVTTVPGVFSKGDSEGPQNRLYYR
jgi:hypothetical protein